MRPVATKATKATINTEKATTKVVVMAAITKWPVYSQLKRLWRRERNKNDAIVC
jgi:hypothetical protein